MLKIQAAQLIFVDIDEHPTCRLFVSLLQDIIQVVVADLPNDLTELAQPMHEMATFEYAVFEGAAGVAIKVLAKNVCGVCQLVHPQPKHTAPES